MLPGASRLILAAWVALVLVFVGVGALFRRGCRAPAEDADGWLLCFWLGWAWTIFALQVWHLLHPVDARILAAVACAGMIGFAASGRQAWLALARGARTNLAPLGATVVVALWLSNRALGGPQNGDSAYYHMPTIRWFAAYPAVPGLGNLFAPLAYNQSYFLYATLLDVGPFSHRSHHVANGILVLALFARVLLGFHRLVQRRRACAPQDLFYALLLPVVVGLAFDINLTSPSPDVAVFALSIVASGQLLGFLSRPAPRPAADLDLLAIALLAAAGITVKLSFVGLAATTPLLAIWLWARRDRPPPAGVVRTVVTMAMLGALGVVPWMIRGIVLSGYPLYPSTLGGIRADWAAPIDSVAAESRLIRYWNGVPGWWRFALHDPLWFGRWLVTLGWLERDVLLPLGIALTVGVAALARRIVRRRAPESVPVPAQILLPTLGALAFCIAAAPRARYSAPFYCVLAAQSVVLAMQGPALGAGRRGRLAVAATTLVVASLSFFDGKPALRALGDFEQFQHVEVADLRLATGLVVKVPRDATSCSDSALPCTPYPNQALRLRRDGDLSSGFRIDPGVARSGPP